MYLLTFVFLMIGMLGIYTQVFAVEIARMYEGQTGIAQTMIDWHGGAMSLAHYAMGPAPPTGCSFTYGLTNPGNCAVTMSTTGLTYTDVNGIVRPLPVLPTGFVGGTFQYNSVAFTNANGAPYVVTYIKPPTTAPYNLTTASGVQLNVTASDLVQQLRHTNLDLLSYGYVSNTGANATLITGQMSTTTPNVPISYAVPLSIPDKSIAIISSPDQ